MRRKVTIDDIASHSNVSRTTVSMVLRDKPGIGVDTRERVLASARELGYQRKLPAAVEIGRTVLNVGLVVRSRSRSREEQIPRVNPFYSWVLTGIEAAAAPQRMNLLYTTLPVDERNRPIELPEHLLGQALDGLLLIGSFSAETVREIATRQRAPMILVDAPSRPHPCDAIASDNSGGLAAAVRYLYSRGHRHIAFAGPAPLSDVNFGQRRDGYLAATAELDVPFFAPEMTLDELPTTLPALLAANPSISAVVGSNDAFAIAALRAAHATGRRVPHDLSIVGFDDIELSAQIEPPLTTLAVDKISMGRLAVQFLANRLAWPGASIALTTLMPTLLERGSVANHTERGG